MRYNFLYVIAVHLLSVTFVSQEMATYFKNGIVKKKAIMEIGYSTADYNSMATVPESVYQGNERRANKQLYFIKDMIINTGFIKPEAAGRQLSNPAKKYWFLVALSVGLLLTLLVCGLFFYAYRARMTIVTQNLKNELRNKTACLKIAGEEQEWLIKEIHHRVKNNLQIVMSLLNTQAIYEHNHAAKNAIRNSQHRMYAISLVHQKLYQSDSLSEVDMVNYTYELIEYLTDAFEVQDKVHFEFNLVPLLLDVSMAVSFGLIINEAITNTLKYAFPADDGGKVSITLTSPDEVNYQLSVADNGIGMAISHKKADSFGNILMAGLARQLGGKYDIKTQNGVEIAIAFERRADTAFNIN